MKKTAARLPTKDVAHGTLVYVNTRVVIYEVEKLQNKPDTDIKYTLLEVKNNEDIHFFYCFPFTL